MTEKNQHNDQFSDDDARNILRRAAEIEKSGVVSETDLRDIAGEASISQAAMNQALEEAQMQKRLASVQADAKLDQDPDIALSGSGRKRRWRNVMWAIAAGWLIAAVVRSC